jgi:hypothetical protein
VQIDGGATLRGRLARPRLVFEGGASRAFAGIFPTPVTTRADGVIGPGALPYDVVTIALGPALAEARAISFPLEDPDVWRVRAPAGGVDLDLTFDMSHDSRVLNRTAARAFDASGAIHTEGSLVSEEILLGLRTMVQPVRTDLSISGLGLGPTQARTNAPLLGADEPDAIVVTAEGERAPESLSLGRAALGRCTSISVDRRTRQLTLSCAN